MTQANDLLKIFEKSERLKITTRHSWTSNTKRQESVAEHSWHVLFMAITLHPYLIHPVDLLHTLKMLIVHDLGEAITGDIPAFEPSPNKYENEKKAIKNITNGLTPSTAAEFLGLWQEFEEKKTPEAIFAKMLDILDVLHEHLIADISTWSEIEFEFNLKRGSERHFIHEPKVHKLYLEILQKLELKVKSHKYA